MAPENNQNSKPKLRKRELIRRRRRLAGSIFIALILTSVLIIGSYQVRPHLWRWLCSNESLMVKSVCVEGVKFTSKNDLIKLIPDVVGSNQFKIDLIQIKNSVKQHPWIEDAEVFRRLPDELVVVVHERQPVALLNGKDLWAIDRTGSLLPLHLWSGSINLPVVDRKLDCPERAGELVDDQQLLLTLNYLNQMKYRLPALWEIISEVTWNKDGNIILHASKSRTQILLNQEPNWNQTLKLYSYFLYEGGESGIQDIKFIDLRFHDQVIVKRL